MTTKTAPVILGIEGGGTHTVALWTDTHEKEVQRAEFGCGNVRLLDDNRLRELFVLIKRAGAELNVVSICAGMAGAVDETDRERVRSIGKEAFGGIPLMVCNDLQTPLYAAEIPGTHYPVLVLCGTGSCCYAETPDKSIHSKTGGWGHILGDRGSAYRIGYLGLRACLECLDSTGKWPLLGERILTFEMLNTPADLISWSLHATKSNIASLARVICESAALNEQIAQQVLMEAATELGRDAVNCARHLEQRAVEWAGKACFLFSGGLLKKDHLYQQAVQKQIASRYSGCLVMVLSLESVRGAVRAALQQWQENESVGIPTVAETFLASSSGNDAPGTQSVPTSPAASSVTEQRNLRSMQLDKLSVEDAVQLMIDEEEYIQQALQSQKAHIVELVQMVTKTFQNGGRLFYAGAGTSGRLGVLDASECPPTFGVSPELVQGIIAGGYEALWRAAEGAEDSPKAGADAAIARGITGKDAVIGIAASGTTPFVKGLLQQAKQVGAKTALLCFNPNRTPYQGGDPDLVLAVPTGPEILTGSTRLKSGTATKLILNMVTTLSMVQTGKVMSNLMIDVRATNEKLRDRAIRILCQLRDWDREKSQSALKAHHWNIRQAMEDNQESNL